MNDKSLEERVIYDGPRKNEEVGVKNALERLYECILNKKKDKMKFFVRYGGKMAYGYPSSIQYYADLFVYKENFQGKFAQLKISKQKLWELEKLGIKNLLPSEKKYRYRYGKVLMDGYWGPENPMDLDHYFSKATIKNVDFTLKRTRLETNAEIKERKAKERLEWENEREKRSFEWFRDKYIN